MSQFNGRPGQGPSRERFSPEEVRSSASTEVTRLQAALMSLGPNNHVERAALEVSWRKAHKQTTTQLDAERAVHRDCEESVVQCRRVGPKEKNEAELWQQRLRAEAEEVIAELPTPPYWEADWEAQVRGPRQQVTELQC